MTAQPKLPPRPGARRTAVLTACLLVLLLTACGGLGGEPNVTGTVPTAAPTQASRVVIDSELLLLGLQVYQAAECAACHGATGAGDGPLAQSGEVRAPGNFLDSQARIGESPQDWFDTITNGNMSDEANPMPPWINRINATNRWAVALYTFTLHYERELLQAGQTLVEANTELAAAVGEITSDNALMARVSDEELAQLIASQVAFDRAQDTAVVAFARAFWLTNTDAATIANIMSADELAEATQEPVPFPTAVAEAAAGTISGQLTSGTEGGSVPAGLEVTLVIRADSSNFQTQTTTIDTDNRYTFSDVTIDPNLTYFVTASHQGEGFASEQVQGDPQNPDLDLPLVLFEVTNDPSVIEIANMVVRVRIVGEVLEFTQVMQYVNTSDRVFIQREGTQTGAPESVRVNLPVGGLLVPTTPPQQFVQSGPDALVHTLPVPPGTYLLPVTYIVPFSGRAIIDFPVDYPLTGETRILVDAVRLELTGDAFNFVNSEEIGGTTHDVYGAALDLTSGGTVQFTLTERGGTIESGDDTVVTSDNLLLILGGIVALIVALGIGLLLLQRRGRRVVPVDRDHMIDGLVRQIAELDADHEAGTINHDVYHHRRQQLKARLAELIDQSGDAGS